MEKTPILESRRFIIIDEFRPVILSGHSSCNVCHAQSQITSAAETNADPAEDDCDLQSKPSMIIAHRIT